MRLIDIWAGLQLLDRVTAKGLQECSIFLLCLLILLVVPFSTILAVALVMAVIPILSAILEGNSPSPKHRYWRKEDYKRTKINKIKRRLWKGYTERIDPNWRLLSMNEYRKTLSKT